MSKIDFWQQTTSHKSLYFVKFFLFLCKVRPVSKIFYRFVSACFTFGFCFRSIKYNFYTPSTRTMLAWISICIENHALCVYSKIIWIWMFVDVLETLIVHHSLSFPVISAHMRSSFIQISVQPILLNYSATHDIRFT